MKQKETAKDWKATYASQIKYDSENTVRTSLKLNRKTESDIIDAIDASPNKQRFIKEAIRFYLAHKGEEE